jgi:hypothetical protein
LAAEASSPPLMKQIDCALHECSLGLHVHYPMTGRL